MNMAGMLFSSALLTGCATGIRSAQLPKPPSSVAAAPLTITGVGVEPKTLDLRTQAEATIHYELSRPADVFVDLVDEEGRVVRKLMVGRDTAGKHTVNWDGHATDGHEVAGGVYRYVIHAQDAEGHRTVYDPSPNTGGEELQPRNFTFDQQTGAFRWVMPKAGRARLRIGLQGFPHLRTLLDWEPLEAGEHTVVWDGLDASGLIQLKGHPRLAIKLSAFALPDNTVIVRGDSRQEVTQIERPMYPADVKREPAYLHARHVRAVCHETGLHLEFPAGTRYDAQHRPLLKGTVPVRVVLDERDASSVTNSRFEVSLYEDLTFLFEEEEGANPFTFLWDTTRLTPGAHLLTVNILSYDDHYGVVTQPVMIESGS